MLEASDGKLFNACVLIGPDGIVAGYRKIHLPFLGIDRFTDPGDRPFSVHSAGELRVGMNICYDSAFPESARVMALDGADLIALPTNFPPGAECMAAHVANTRAMENNVYYACVNRVGTERGFPFIGQSKICDPSGRLLAEAAHTNEEILYADIDIQRARTKRIVRVPDKHIIDRFNDRRPEMYGRINAK
jgi:predicted amidohydrolase